MLEGEAGLVMAGLLTHTGDMNLYMAILLQVLVVLLEIRYIFTLEDLIKQQF